MLKIALLREYDSLKKVWEREGQREIAKEGQREALDNILDKWNVKQIRWLLIKMQMKLYSH